jgi:flavin reductase (DIM6/NTAB) family NADH-FMN oxidoreductase RutF
MKRPIPVWQAYRLLQPGPVALVTARYRDKENVMAVAWAAPVSYDPPRLGIAVAPTCLTYDLIRRSELFALNFPGRPLAEQVDRAGVTSGRDVDDKLAAVGLTPADADEIDVALIDECIAHIECGLVGAYELGDHVWLVGEVVAAAADDEAFDEMWLIGEDEAQNPLWHLGGSRYAAPVTPAIEVVRDQAPNGG